MRISVAPRVLAALILCSTLSASEVSVGIRKPIQPNRPAPLPGRIVRNSGYIFAGTVLKVEPIRAKSPLDVPVVQITFRVTQAIQGVRAGQTLTIREWAGFWTSSERYRVGERVMLFLYKPSRLGLTSPVGGDLGRFHTDAQGLITVDQTMIPGFLPNEGARPPVRGPIQISPKNLVRMMKAARVE